MRYAGLVCGLLTAVGMQAEAQRPWTVSYGRTGGIAGISEHATLTDSGHLTISGRAVQGGPTQFEIDSAHVAEVEAALAELRLVGTPATLPRTPPYPDMMTTTLEVNVGGRTYPFAPGEPASRRLMAVMSALYQEGQRRANDAYWARSGAFKAGRVWTVREEVRDTTGRWHGESWIGRWERQGESNTFMAVWHNSVRPNDVMRDTIDLVSAGRARVLLVRRGTHQKYDGFYKPAAPREVIGTIDPSHGCSFWATIEY